MNRDEFDFMARLLYESSGLVVTRDKMYLFENRLMPVVREHEMKSVDDLIVALRQDGSEPLRRAAVEAMMVTDTGFFRDWAPFVHFRDVVLPNLFATRSDRRAFRVLCAGVSRGQEAYSVALALAESGSQLGWNIEVLGVDISATAIAAAESATYTQFEVQRGLPIRMLVKFFDKREGLWHLNEKIRKAASFRTWNLLDELFPLGRFDVILCRNVLVYFDLGTKLRVLQRLSRLLADDGVFYLGLNEAITGMTDSLRAVDPAKAIYAVHRHDRAQVRSLAGQ